MMPIIILQNIYASQYTSLTFSQRILERLFGDSEVLFLAPIVSGESNSKGSMDMDRHLILLVVDESCCQHYRQGKECERKQSEVVTRIVYHQGHNGHESCQ